VGARTESLNNARSSHRAEERAGGECCAHLLNNHDKFSNGESGSTNFFGKVHSKPPELHHFIKEGRQFIVFALKPASSLCPSPSISQKGTCHLGKFEMRFTQCD
jgi:hypothetical protein